MSASEIQSEMGHINQSTFSTELESQFNQFKDQAKAEFAAAMQEYRT
jgi:hypothetical protein